MGFIINIKFNFFDILIKKLKCNHYVNTTINILIIQHVK